MELPGGKISGRPLHVIWILDCSSSMEGEKIESLNTAIRDAIPYMRDIAKSNPHAEIMVRAVTFSSGAKWHILNPVKIEDFEWQDIKANGVTDMGKAFSLVAEQLKTPPMPERALPPLLILVSDGMPTDNYKEGLAKLMNEPWGKKAVRIAIAIGSDADEDVLKEFIGNREIPVLRANNATSLINYIKWVSTVVLKETSSPSSQTSSSSSSNINIPAPPPSASEPASENEIVW